MRVSIESVVRSKLLSQSEKSGREHDIAGDSMRNLSSLEVSAIKSTVESIKAKREVVALLAYGSQVAGYTTKESDYDVVLVLKPFTQRIRFLLPEKGDGVFRVGRRSKVIRKRLQ